jgi:hypothetical protein
LAKLSHIFFYAKKKLPKKDRNEEEGKINSSMDLYIEKEHI